MYYRNDTVNQWKKFLLSLPLDTVKQYIRLWESSPRTYNTNILLNFAKALVHDNQTYKNTGLTPAEFDPRNYRHVSHNVLVS